MSQKIAANIITGFLGVGKTTAILHALAHKPADETWAVLVNEFGEVGIDGAILKHQGALVREVPGGCMCCVAGLPMKIGLNMLLAKRPDRLLIEPTGLGHPLQIIHTLTGEYYGDLLDLRATISLVDPRKLHDRRYTENENFRDQLALADVVAANKTDQCSVAERRLFERHMAAYQPAKAAVGWISRGELELAWLDLPRQNRASAPAHAHAGDDDLPAQNLTLAPGQLYLGRHNTGQGYHSYGWLFAPAARFRFNAMLSLLHELDVQRVKAVLKTDTNPVCINAENGVVSVSTLNECVDSRIELIHSEPLPWQRIESAILDCLATPLPSAN